MLRYNGALRRAYSCDGKAPQALVHDNAWQVLDQLDGV